MLNVPQRPWTDAERALLRRMRRNGVELKDIAAALNRSYGSIQRQIRYLQIQTQEHKKRKPAEAPKPPAPQRAGAITLPPLPSLANE
jgi:IS30 family transposase